MDTLETIVGNVLTKSETGKIKFTLGPVSVDASSYKGVKAQIDAGKIKVVYDAKRGNGGVYRYTHNTLFLGFRIADKADQQAVIVHECTHAACDIAGKSMLVSHSEAAAYVAQCLFFYYVNEAALSSGKNKPSFTSAILTAAWNVADKARQNPSLAEKDYKPLLEAIAGDKDYKDRHDKTEKYDGV